jgi:phosphate transport system substrate-binding protein
LNGIAPTVENISSGKYLLYRPLYIVTAAKMTPEVQKFIKFVKSPEGQEVIASQGTVTLAQGSGLWKPYREHMKTVAGDKKGVFE